MRTVRLLARLDAADPLDVFEKIIDFERYPELVDPVRSIKVETVSESEIITWWSVLFRKGILNWSEREFIDRQRLVLTFEQEEGDFELLTGGYRVVGTDGGGVDIHLDCTFDFGVASIESIVEPIAARVLKENFELVLIGLLGSQISFPPVPDEPAATPAPHAVLDYATNESPAPALVGGDGRVKG